MTLASGAEERWAYANSTFPYLPSSLTGFQGHTTSYGYQSQGLLSSVTDAAGHTTSYTYNSNGTLASMTDPNGHSTGYSYNSLGLRSGITYPSPLGAESITYDSYNLVNQVVNGKGQTTSYSWDQDNQPTGISSSDGTSVGYSLNQNEQVAALSDATGSTNYGFNALNQVIQKVLPNGYKTVYSWDGMGNLLSTTDDTGGGGTTSYTYTPDNQVATVSDASGKTTLGYDSNDNRTSIAYPNGVTEALTWNGARQLTKIAGSTSSGTLTSYQYSYTDPSTGKATALRYSLTTPSGTTSYGYDALNRLTSAGSDSYAYDAAGNLTSLARNGTTTSLSSNAANELTNAGGTTDSYDANGNQTGSSAGFAASYNAQNQTTSMTPPGGTAITMTYTGAGQADRVTAGGTSFHYDDVTGIDHVSTSNGTTYCTHLPDGTLIDERTPSGTLYPLVDGNGSVMALTNSSGSIVDQYTYDPYGAMTVIQQSIPNVFGFDGGIEDTATGLVKFGERSYNPQVGRWTQMPPWGVTPGIPRVWIAMPLSRVIR